VAAAPITELKGRHEGEDLWVIASGPSAGHIDPAFFEGKVTIGVNRVWTRFRTTYLVVKESAVLQQAITTGATVIASKHSCGTLSYEVSQADGEFYTFEHPDNKLTEIDLAGMGPDQLVVSFSTITSAMHAAAYLGASNIILVGHDCGKLDGRQNFEGYPDPLIQQEGFYESFLGRLEETSKQVRAWLESEYGCRIYSLNPFLNFGLEGHQYEHAG
jgi:hypothetical protein